MKKKLLGIGQILTSTSFFTKSDSDSSGIGVIIGFRGSVQDSTVQCIMIKNLKINQQKSEIFK